MAVNAAHVPLLDYEAAGPFVAAYCSSYAALLVTLSIHWVCAATAHCITKWRCAVHTDTWRLHVTAYVLGGPLLGPRIIQMGVSLACNWKWRDSLTPVLHTCVAAAVCAVWQELSTGYA